MGMQRLGSLLMVLFLGLTPACKHSGHGRSSAGPTVSVMQTQFGIASIYQDRRTASGERSSATACTAAHKVWPMGSRVRVTHLGTGRQVIVRINDRGPFTRGRVIDLTPFAAAEIGLTRQQGIARVKIERLK